MVVKIPGVMETIQSSVESDKTLRGFTKAVVLNSFPEINRIVETGTRLAEFLSADDKYIIRTLSEYLSQVDEKKDGFNSFEVGSEIDESILVPIGDSQEHNQDIYGEEPNFLFSHTGGVVDYELRFKQDPEFDAVTYTCEFHTDFSEVLGDMDLPEGFLTNLSVMYGGMFIPYDKTQEKAGNKFVFFLAYEIHRKGQDTNFGNMFFHAIPTTLRSEDSLKTLFEKEEEMPFKTDPEDSHELFKNSKPLRAYYEYPSPNDDLKIQHMECLYVPLGIQKMPLLEDCHIFYNVVDKENTYLRD